MESQLPFDEDVEKAIEEEVPAFFRSIARQGLVDYARKKGVDRVTMDIYVEAKARYLSGR